jgi:hypothetical protein
LLTTANQLLIRNPCKCENLQEMKQ